MHQALPVYGLVALLTHVVDLRSNREVVAVIARPTEVKAVLQGCRILAIDV